MRSQENQIITKSIRNAIGKKYHLTFCHKYKYCESGPYKNDIGEDIPQIFEYKGFFYELKYYAGCFNPFLEPCKSGLFVKVDNKWHQIYNLERLQERGIKVQSIVDRRTEAQVLRSQASKIGVLN